MKNTILLFIAFTIASISFAQQPSFGVRAGYVSSGMRGEAVNNFKNLLDFTDGMITTSNHSGFFAGGYASIPVGEIVSIEPGLYYSQKGYDVKGTLKGKGVELLGVNAGAKLTSQYIDLPVLIKANISGFQVFAGPQVSYLAKSDLRTTAGVLGFNLLNTKMDATEQFNRWDVGLTGGVGYQFANGVNISAAYDHGLSKVDANQNFDSYNRAFKVGVGVTF
ncbi:MAG: porin family protein [Chitinophagaceae bacterium]